MSIMLSGDEVFSLAKEIEKSGRAYYQTVAAATDSAALRELFEFLAGEEQKHLRFFESLSAEYPDLTVDEDEWEQTSEYIRATTESRFFVGEEKAIRMAESVDSPDRAVEVAIGFEKDTLLFFHELLEITPERSKEAARKIVEEEKRHVKMLSQKRKELAAS